MKRLLLVWLLGSLWFTACSKKNDSTITPTPPITPPTELVYDYTSDYPHNLNVIYFTPNDVAKPAAYHRRLSEILLSTQAFFGNEMQRNGYGYKTFGLLKDTVQKRIKLIEITGTQGKSAYPYEGGAEAVERDINNYKATHASEFTSEHSLIIMPASTYDADGEPGGVPFFGLDKNCFALDYVDQDIKYLGAGGKLGRRATTWIGGMVHELGHGLNLPHNKQKYVSEASLGMALMSAGNYTWGVSKTFLTGADCAVLNTNQVFNKDLKTYYGNVVASIENIQAKYEVRNAAIIISGKYSSSVPVTDMLYFNDPNVDHEGTGGNHDYNAIAWTSKPISPDSFYVQIPILDLEYKSDNIPYEFKVKMVHENGNVTETDYAYTFFGGIPLLNFSTRTELSKEDWHIVSCSSEETSGEEPPNGPAINLIDKNASTYWHSQWSKNAGNYPYEFVIDMGSIKNVDGLSITQRQGLNRSIKNAALYISKDGINFLLKGSYVFANKNGPQYFDFSERTNFRYFKIIANTAWDGLRFAALAEVGMY